MSSSPRNRSKKAARAQPEALPTPFSCSPYLEWPVFSLCRSYRAHLQEQRLSKARATDGETSSEESLTIRRCANFVCDPGVSRPQPYAAAVQPVTLLPVRIAVN
jgi:hypothetical protein